MPDGRIGHLGDNCALQCLPNAKSITAANLQAPATEDEVEEVEEEYFATASVAVCHFVPKLN